MTFPNRVYFDLNSSDHWNNWKYWFECNSLFHNPRLKCQLSFNDCVNLHKINECYRRTMIEGNPFTRPMSARPFGSKSKFEFEFEFPTHIYWDYGLQK